MPGRGRSRGVSLSISRSPSRSRSASSLRSRSRSPLNGGTAASYVVNLRGLPYSATEKDVKRFLGDCSAGLLLVEFGSKEGKPDGECWLEFGNSADYRKALGRDRDFMGKRYIEVVESSPSERRRALNPERYRGSFILRLRGMPYGISKEEIKTFFRGSTIAPNGIIILVDNTGRQVGDAFVNFEDVQSRDRALDRDREKIGRRYIEIFKSDQRELDMKLEKFATQQGSAAPPIGGGPSGARARKTMFDHSSSPDGGGGNGHFVFVRGMPFSSNEKDLKLFFMPLVVKQVTVGFDNRSKPSGDANVEFYSHEDALAAMRKHGSYMGNRYLELQLNSTSAAGPAGGGYAGGGSTYSSSSYRR